ncbi:hypothetical protein [Mesorhizobium sp. INR15]|uniref:hypothetical protein n=1 Tax=Mesorhizobium sp. INR15 TaxID=2654248 RepID=UPI00189664CD|nr:hypothetical protein [Mesorhizobium sp. INR15]QPC91641.1 hypothetical protein GA829_14125 [Mesorhizobium sp. INR15]
MKKSPTRKAPTFDHSELGLGSAELKAIRKCEAEIMLLGRRTTEETFDLGDQLNIAAAFIPDGMFGKWAVSVSRYSRQHLFSLMKIATVLKDHRTRLVEARMSATAMGHLASSPEHVNEVLAEFEAGRSLTAKQIQAIVGGGNEKPDTDLPNLGGVAGLKANAQAKLKLGISEFTRKISSIIADIEAALVPALEGKRVLKGQLADKIERPARLARFQLENVATFVELNPNNSAASQVIGFPKGSKWREVTDLLWVLGGRDSWTREELAPWLQTGVLPLLAWSVGDGKDVSTDPESE